LKTAKDTTVISDKRREELDALFWTETEIPWTQEWRENLTDEEEALLRE
jgi:hypothetical protein